MLLRFLDNFHLKTASAEWSYSAEAFAKGGDRDEQIGGILHPSPLFIIVHLYEGGQGGMS